MAPRSRVSRWFRPRVEAVGLEMGTANLKVVEVRAGSPPSLARLAMRPTPPGLMEDDHVIDGEGLATELRTLFDDAGIDNRHVVTAIGNRQAITRNIHVPRMSRSELAEAIKWEAERYIPFPIDEVTLAYHVLDDPDTLAEGDDLEVVVVAARLDLVREELDVLNRAGLEPIVIDVKPFALLRSLKGVLPGDESPTKRTAAYTDSSQGNDIGVVIEVAASSTTITLVRGDRVLMNRNIAVSGDDFTTALQRRFGLDFDTAEHTKIHRGTALLPADAEDDLLDPDADTGPYSAPRVYDTLRPVVASLTTEIRRSLEFFRVQSGDTSIEHMFMTGGGAKLQGLPEALEDALGIPVRLGQPWHSLTADERRFDMAYLEGVGAEFGVPLGLALRGVSLDD